MDKNEIAALTGLQASQPKGSDAEAHRLDVLKGFGVLDTPREPAYDQIVGLAAALCETPIALISLVDEKRQWFKAVHGADWQSTERDISFCAHAIEQRGLFVVEDAAQDPRFVANPLVCGEVGLRFYAGVPLTDANGVSLGALAVIDRVPRRLTRLQQHALEVLATQVVALFVSQRRQRMLEAALLDRERSEAALRESEGRWRLLFERSPQPMWVFDTETLRFLAVNDAAVVHYGWSPSEFLSMTLRDIRPSNEVPALLEDIAGGHDELHGGRIWRHRKKNGELIEVDVVANSFPFNGRSARLVMAFDVTERQRAIESLRASDARWQRLFDASATGIAIIDADGRLASANPAFCRLVQSAERQVPGQAMLDFLHPEERANLRSELERMVAGRTEVLALDLRVLPADGVARWVRAAITLTHETGRSDHQFVAVVQDIDAQRRAESALRQQHALVQAAGRLAGLGGWEVSLGPTPSVNWTEELREILEIPAGTSPSVEEALAMYLPGSRERITEAFRDCVEHGKPFDLELDLRTMGGRMLHGRALGRAVRGPDGRIEGAQGALLDQTKLHRAQRAMRESEERFRLVARATADAIWDWDLVKGEVWWNEGIESLFGHSLQSLEAGAESWTRRIHPDDIERIEGSIHAVIEGSQQRWAEAYRFRRADGTWADVEDRGFVIRDDQGKAIRMVGGMTDVSGQRKTERQLQLQADLLNAARDAIVVRDLDDRITYWSRGAERLFGWSAAEALGQRSIALLAKDEAVEIQARQQVLSTGQWQSVIPVRTRNGRLLRVDARLTLLRDEEGRPEAVLAIKTDVTQRFALEAQLQQSQRLEAVGQLTGGVAHDFNNLLTVIRGNAELLADELTSSLPLQDAAKMVVQAAERGAGLTQRLLAFARRQPLSPQRVDANHLLSGLEPLLRCTLQADIAFELIRQADLWPLEADPVQLESALMNLVLNARDAMPSGGRICLESSNVWVDPDDAERPVDLQPGAYVKLSVIDSGIGMNEGELTRAFEPFYTTKPAGKGSGLGLSMVYGFVKQSGGHASLRSVPGSGTTASLFLPRAEPGAKPAQHERSPRETTAMRGSERVLVVEDDDLVRRYATDLLRSLGYEVLTADSGSSALALLREGSAIDLLFTDLVMPGGLNGHQLADAALTLNPRLKVLITSGYADASLMNEGAQEKRPRLLSKPYRAADLARRVREVLA